MEQMCALYVMLPSKISPVHIANYGNEESAKKIVKILEDTKVFDKVFYRKIV